MKKSNTKDNKNGRKRISQNPAKIKVVGIGGGGGNAIHRMKNYFLKGVDFIAINTDVQDLAYCDVPYKVHIGKNLTRGLGTGMNPELGRQAAEETKAEIIEVLKGADLIFITAGLGGGTGTGAIPVVAEAAKELGALTIGVVTKPFSFEGAQRGRIAQEGFLKLKDKVDTLILIPNDRIFAVIDKDTTLPKAFEIVDDVLRYAVQGIADLIAMPGIINVDFADVKTIMENAGTALVGLGVSTGPERAVKAVTQAIHSPLLEISIQGAKGVLFGVSGGKDIKMSEINDIAKVITEAIDPSAKIIFGAYHDKKIKPGALKVTIIATGFNGLAMGGKTSFQASSLFNIPGETDKKITFSEPIQIKEEKLFKKKTSAEMWEVPAFLRRGKKKK